MEKLKAIINDKSQWEELKTYISIIEKNKETNSNLVLDAAKSLIETIVATILHDKDILFDSDDPIGKKVKTTFENLEIFEEISEVDNSSAIQILNAFVTIVKQIGTYRNTHGFISHGKDLKKENFNRYLVELVINSAETISCFFIENHDNIYSRRIRKEYDNYLQFNKWLDETSEDYPEYLGIVAEPSKFLFRLDEIAYFEKNEEFYNENIELIKEFTEGWTIYSLEDLYERLEYLEEEQIKFIFNHICNYVNDKYIGIAEKLLDNDFKILEQNVKKEILDETIIKINTLYKIK